MSEIKHSVNQITGIVKNNKTIIGVLSTGMKNVSTGDSGNGYGVTGNATILADGLVDEGISGSANILGKNTSGYVTDGLQMLFDGEFKNCIGNPMGWQNQISDKMYSFTGNEQKTDNSFVFDKATYLKTDELAAYKYPTVEVVFKPAISQDSEMDIVSTFESGGYGICLIKNKANFTVNIDGKYHNHFSKTTVSLNEIYSVSGSYNGEKMLVAQNGVIYEVAQTGNIKHSIAPLEIGRNAATDAEILYFKGEIYCVRVYNRALTEAEIQQNYAIDKQRFGIA